MSAADGMRSPAVLAITRVEAQPGVPAGPAAPAADGDAATPAWTANEVQEGLQQTVLRGTRQLSLWLTGLFAVFAPFDWFFTAPAGAGRIAAVLDVGAALLMGALHLLARRWGRPRHANLLAAGMAVAALPYVLLNVWLTGMPVLLAGLALWQIGICLIFLSWRWTVGLVLLSSVLGAAEVAYGLASGHLPPSDDWSQYAYVIASSAVIGLVAHGVRLNTYRRLEALRSEERWRRIQVEQAQATARELETARRVNRIKTDFINTAAHELSTPLTPVLLQSHILKQELQNGTPQQRRSIELLDRNLQRLHALLQDILDSARIQSDSLPMRRQAVDVAAVVHDCVQQYTQACHARGLHLVEAPGAPSGLTVLADSKRIHQVLENLLSNALKFTPRGGTIEVRLGKQDDRVLVEVVDTGAGIPPVDAGKLFAPFVQVHSSLQAGGTGLGLYISRGIVEHYGGTIGCESQGPGTGTTFWFTLPMHDVTASTALTTAQDAQAGTDGDAGPKAPTPGRP